MGSANERRRYIVTSSLIGWARTVPRMKHHDTSPFLNCSLILWISLVLGISLCLCKAIRCSFNSLSDDGLLSISYLYAYWYQIFLYIWIFTNYTHGAHINRLLHRKEYDGKNCCCIRVFLCMLCTDDEYIFVAIQYTTTVSHRNAIKPARLFQLGELSYVDLEA